MKEFPQEPFAEPRRRQARLGALLILIGAGMLITYGLRMAWIPAWVAGLALLGWGVAQRRPRLILVGGIATGAGLAVAVQTGPWIQVLSSQARTSLFLMCLSLGWLLIPALTRLATAKTIWWPLLPGTVLAITGVTFWISAGWVQAFCNLVWPLLLVVAGLVLIARWNRAK